MANLFELFEAVEALDIWMVLIHPAPERCRLLAGIARRGNVAFRTIEASSMRTFVRMAHHGNDCNAGHCSGGLFFKDCGNAFLLFRFGIFKYVCIAHEL